MSIQFIKNKIFYKNNYININNILRVSQLNIIMDYFIYLVSLCFNDFYFFVNTTLLLVGLWVFFFKLNTNTAKISSKNSSNISITKISSNNSFLGFYFCLVTYKVFDVYTVHGKNSLVWFNHFQLSNFTISLLYGIIILGGFLFFILNAVTNKTNLIKSIDYLFSIKNLLLLIPYLFFVNTIFTFLFLLELISVVLLYKLISSKIWFKNLEKSRFLVNNIPQNYINMVFFQYWITFFSTVFIIYFYVNIYHMYGTTDWFLVQFINLVDGELLYSNIFLIRLVLCVFVFSVFFKLGLTPFHLFKVEVYKGLPYLSIFFYTTYYFVVFFIFFIFLLSDYLFTFCSYYYFLIVFLLFLGSIYVVFLLFDVNFLKAFFTYSTIINTIGFLMVFVSSL